MVDWVRPNFLGNRTEFSNMFERPIQVGFENVFLVLAFAVFSNLYMLKTNCDDNHNNDLVSRMVSAWTAPRKMFV